MPEIPAYPDLKANQNFLQLQEEIADVENKLAAVRRYFNSATKEYNNAVQTFQSNIVAGMTGFQREIMFDLGKDVYKRKPLYFQLNDLLSFVPNLITTILGLKASAS